MKYALSILAILLPINAYAEDTVFRVTMTEKQVIPHEKYTLVKFGKKSVDTGNSYNYGDYAWRALGPVSISGQIVLTGADTRSGGAHYVAKVIKSAKPGKDGSLNGQAICTGLGSQTGLSADYGQVAINFACSDYAKPGIIIR